MHLTDLAFKKLKVPESGRITYSDDVLPGFGVRVSATGHKSFVLLIGRARKRITIGRHPTITLAEARARARELVAARVLGKEEHGAIKFEDALPLFLESHYPNHRLKPRTRTEAERVLKRHFLAPWRYEPLHTITTHQVAERIDKMHRTPSEARHAFAVLRTFFNWAERRRYVLKSPCYGLKPPKEAPPRERVLSKQEIHSVLTAARAHPCTFSSIVELLLYTGQRRSEIASLQYEWVDWECRTITFPSAITKNKRPHTIPFGDRVQKLLRGTGRTSGYLFLGRGTETPFDGWSKCKPKLDQHCQIPHWTLHDLRRTFATNLAALGVQVHVTEKLLNHVSGTMGGIVAVYQRHSFAKEMREGIVLWAVYLDELMRESPYEGTDIGPHSILSTKVAQPSLGR